MPTKIWPEKYNRGCEWCGTRFPGIRKDSAGLDSCHIIARDYAPEHEWNVFLLCPNCHRIFDQVVKPKMQHAINMAITGFGDNPDDKKKRYVVATDFRIILKALIKRDDKAEPDEALPDQITELLVWRDRPNKVPLPKSSEGQALLVKELNG